MGSVRCKGAKSGHAEEQRPSPLSLPPPVGRGPRIGKASGGSRTVGLPPPSQIPVDGTPRNSPAPGRPPTGLPHLPGAPCSLRAWAAVAACKRKIRGSFGSLGQDSMALRKRTPSSALPSWKKNPSWVGPFTKEGSKKMKSCGGKGIFGETMKFCRDRNGENLWESP
ncbi:hypothetical protein LIER_25651 [Lithospermum erythrorhizon]|uniref:Uncharacterized protein n=1 Tax=Lithospermum erythrorhizon TaxID=34254 RepID=A0AAV3RBE9_LITER